MKKLLFLVTFFLVSASLFAGITGLTTDAYWRTGPYVSESPGQYNFIVDDEAPVASNGSTVWAVDVDMLTGRSTFKVCEDIRAVVIWNIAFDMFHDPICILSHGCSYDSDFVLTAGEIAGLDGAWSTTGFDATDVKFSISFVFRALTSDGKVYRANLNDIAGTLRAMEPGFSDFEDLPVLKSFR